MKYLPLFLDLRNRAVLVVGNGDETEAKVQQLVESGAAVTVAAPEPLPGVRKLQDDGKIEFHARPFAESDLDDVWLVVGTTTDRALNEKIVAAATERRVFYNIVDVTDLCAFIYPAIVARDDVQIAISTSGKSPALAQRLKRVISAVVGPEYGTLNDLLGGVRERVIRLVPDRAKRASLFHRMVDSTSLFLLRDGRRDEVERKLAQMTDEAAGQNAVETRRSTEPKMTAVRC